MKNISILFVLLCIFSVFGLVTAQTAELPAIDEAEAADYLGTWFLDQMCVDDQCMSMSDMGVTGTAEVNTDNTIAVTFGDQEPTVNSWYMEDGKAYMRSETEEGSSTTDITIAENGQLIVGDASTRMTFNREEKAAWGSGEVKADAAFEDFEGEWFLKSMTISDMSIPASLFGLEGKLVIREDSLDMIMSGEEGPDTGIPYELKDGTITADITSGDRTDTAVIQYHMDDSVVVTFVVNETESSMVFIREENMTEGLNLMDLINSAAAEEGAAEQ